MRLDEIFGLERKAALKKAKKRQNVLRFILRIRGEKVKGDKTARDINKEIFTQGDCGRFFLIMNRVYPESTAVWDSKQHHVLVDIDGELFDINGSQGQREEYPNSIRDMSEKELKDEMLHCRYSFTDRGPAW